MVIKFILPPTDTDRFFHAQSHHHPGQKRSVMNVPRVISLSETNNLPVVPDHVSKSFLNIVYKKQDFVGFSRFSFMSVKLHIE